MLCMCLNAYYYFQKQVFFKNELFIQLFKKPQTQTITRKCKLVLELLEQLHVCVCVCVCVLFST
eukprot:m.197352 g.197352  ORF g.197352 m.197352 type:complete len:64 (+) comp13682_c0_seq1:893-1084(+)